MPAAATDTASSAHARRWRVTSARMTNPPPTAAPTARGTRDGAGIHVTATATSTGLPFTVIATVAVWTCSPGAPADGVPRSITCARWSCQANRPPDPTGCQSGGSAGSAPAGTASPP